MTNTVLVTGGCGYIGSHTVVALAQAGFTPVIVDNLFNSEGAIIAALGQICGTPPTFYQADVRDEKMMADIILRHGIRHVVHFAALKSVAESVERPLDYYHNNVGGLLALLNAALKGNIEDFVFSSSATVYAPHSVGAISETAPIGPINPYGGSKAMGEKILHDAAAAHPVLRVALLRYFNPVGAHPSGLIGELPRGVPNNLMPYMCQVAAGVRNELTVFGTDYDTPDGSAIRDYIHVTDVADAHVKALQVMIGKKTSMTLNLGTGTGHSVLDMIAAFERANNLKLPYTIGPRRAGDAVVVYANANKARDQLGWTARLSLDDMCRDAWNWQKSLKSV